MNSVNLFRGRSAMLLLALVLVSGCALRQEQQFVDVLVRHQTRYPLMELQDIYKLVYQASQGSVHLAGDSLMASKYLLSEIAVLTSDTRESLCDPISSSGDLVRVHLRPFVLSGEQPEALVNALLQTIRAYEGSTERLRRYWGYAEAAAAAGKLPYPVEEMRAYFADRAEEGFPAVHHSLRFNAAYRPAYRVIMRRYLPFSCRQQALQAGP